MTILECVPICSKHVNNILFNRPDTRIVDSSHCPKSGHVGKEGGHEQMLGQAAAVLVSLSTLVTLQITAAAGLLAVLYQMLAFTRTSHTRLVEFRVFVFIHVVHLVIVDGALASIRLPIHGHTDSVARQTGRW